MSEVPRPFFEFWRARAAFIEKLDPREHFYEANALPSAAIDALAWLWARCRQPDLNQPGRARRRMGSFLALHGGDPFQRVSLPALWARGERLAQDSTTPEILARLRTFGGRQQPNILDRRARLIREDPLVTEVLHDLNDIVAEKVTHGTTVTDLVLACRLGEIAYTEVRCSILHEGRLGEGTHGFELGDDGPTYLSDVFGIPPQIGFSPRYMVRVLRACIDGFEREVKEAGIDPVPPPRGCIVLDLDEELEP